MTKKDMEKQYVQRNAILMSKADLRSDFVAQRYSEVLASGFPMPSHASVNPIKDCLMDSFLRTPKKKPIFPDT